MWSQGLEIIHHNMSLPSPIALIELPPVLEQATSWDCWVVCWAPQARCLDPSRDC